MRGRMPCAVCYTRGPPRQDSMRTVTNSVALICSALAACASVPNAQPPARAPAAACPQPVEPAGTAAPAPPLPISLANNLRPAAWSDLPGWAEDSALDAFASFLHGCAALRNKIEWQKACADAADTA